LYPATCAASTPVIYYADSTTVVQPSNLLDARYNLPMTMLGLAAVAIAASQQPMSLAPRFELAAPLPTAPAVMLDSFAVNLGHAQHLARARGLQARILWIDTTANIDRYNTEEKIVNLVRQIRDVGFNTIVFDIKPISGQVVWPSKLAPKIVEWRGRILPPDFDPLAVFVREAKAQKIPLFVSMNAFSEGHRMFLVGPGYDRPDQQTVLYESRPILRSTAGETFPLATNLNTLEEDAIGVFSTAQQVPPAAEGAFAVTLRRDMRVHDGYNFGGVGQEVPTIPRGGVALYATGAGADFLRRVATPGAPLQFASAAEFVPIRERPMQQIPLMMNPHHPEVRKYALDILAEVVANYDVSGVIYDDRLRYGAMNADFSEHARRQFEQAVGQPVQWPSDAFEYTYNLNLSRGVRPGRFYDQWLAFRAQTMQSFVVEARQTIQRIRPRTQFGAYVGSWYGEYPKFGHNYADTNVDAGFWFLSPNYRRTATAPLFDFLVTGAYYPTATIHEAMQRNVEIGRTVEAAGTLTNRLVRDQAWTYAGIMLSDFRDDPDGLLNAMQAATGSTQGVMVFDLSHDIDPFWPVFRRAFAQPRIAPHEVPDVLLMARGRRAEADKRGEKDPPIIIAAGSPGTGH
jgi:uncharacterized lipoprotein YddW (UPF0748 family)